MAGRTQLRHRLPGSSRARIVAGGTALGVAARLVDVVAPKWVGNLGATWVLAGFLAGYQLSRPRLGERAGALCLAVATVAYYAVRLVLDPISLGHVVGMPLAWLAFALVTGFVAGGIGSRARLQPAWWGAPAGVFLGEGVAVLALRGRVSQAVAEACCALLFVGPMRRGWRRGLVIAFAATPTVALFATYYRLVLYFRVPF